MGKNFRETLNEQLENPEFKVDLKTRADGILCGKNVFLRVFELLAENKVEIEFYFNDSKDLEKALKDIEYDNNFFKYVSSTVYQSGRNLNANEIEYYTYDTYNYLCIVFKER